MSESKINVEQLETDVIEAIEYLGEDYDDQVDLKGDAVAEVKKVFEFHKNKNEEEND